MYGALEVDAFVRCTASTVVRFVYFSFISIISLLSSSFLPLFRPVGVDGQHSHQVDSPSFYNLMEVRKKKQRKNETNEKRKNEKSVEESKYPLYSLLLPFLLLFFHFIVPYCAFFSSPSDQLISFPLLSTYPFILFPFYPLIFFPFPSFPFIPKIEKTVEVCKELLSSKDLGVSTADLGIIAAFRSQVSHRSNCISTYLPSYFFVQLDLLVSTTGKKTVKRIFGIY